MTTEAKQRHEGDQPRKYELGDLVCVAGYEGRVYQVDGYTHRQCVYRANKWTELTYDVTCVWRDNQTQTTEHMSLDWVGAFEEDMSLLVSAGQADEYLRSLTSEHRKTKPGKSVDALLAEMSDYKRLYETFGDDEYKARVTYIKRKLRRAAR